MKLILLSVDRNCKDREFNLKLAKKIEVLGYEIILNNFAEDADAAILVFDNRPLPAELLIITGKFYQFKKGSKKLLAGYNFAQENIEENLKVYFDHIAPNEKNLIGCLKDFLFFTTHGSNK